MARHVRALGGLVVVLAASTVWAQPPGGGRGFGRGFGGPTSGTMLLAIEEVREELKTTDEQNTKIETLTSDARTKMQEAFGGFQELQGLDEEERNKRMTEGRQKMEQIGKESDAKLADILKPEQLDRLNELRMQRDGINSIARDEVAEMLALTADQKTKVKQIVDAGRQQTPPRNFRDLSEEEREKAMTEARERREKTQSDLLAVLTDEQKKTWEEIQGEKFTFPERGGRGGR